MGAPVNVKLRAPTEDVENWQEQAVQWTALNREAGGNPDFFPLTIKAAYVIGVIHDICASVSYLLGVPNARQTTYIPAYGVFASGIEILGRCIRGNFDIRGNVEDIKAGFKWLVSSSYENVPEDYILIKTSSNNEYTIDMLTALRHFAAHGQATSKYQFDNIDYGILSMMPPLIANGLERYWNELQHNDTYCNRLAKANIIALRNWPVLKSWFLFERNKHGVYHTITEIFNKFDWRV